MKKTVYTPNLEMARRHLLLLDEEAKTFVFQTFDDRKGQNDKSLARVFNGTIEQHVKELTYLQALGAGVFVTINQSKNGLRKGEDIVAARAVFREADEQGLPPLPLEPHFIIQSSPGKMHEYLLINPTEDLDKWDQIMMRMVQDYGSDPNARDRARVLRLAGFYHLKDPASPHLVKIIHEGGGLPYTLEKVAESIPPIELFNIPSGASAGWTVEKITERCTFLSHAYTERQSLSEPDWWRALSNIVRISPGGRSLAHTFSKGYPGYSQREADAKILQVLDKPPHTCKNIKQSFACGCDCGVTSPIQLFYKKTIGSSTTDIPDEDIVKAAFQGQKGAASLFVRLYRGKFCYDHAAGVWYIWTGHYWMREPVGEPLAAIGKVAVLFDRASVSCKEEIIILEQAMDEAAREEQVTIKQDLEKLCSQQKACSTQTKNLNALGYRKQVVEFAAQGPDSLGISGDEWDQHQWLLPCSNGVVDLKTGGIRSGRPEEYLKTACPTLYDHNANAKAWLKALDEIFCGDAELVLFVQRLLGMALIGTALEHVLIVFWGAGRNGKDTLLQTIGAVLGALAGPVQSELLLDQGKSRSSASPSADIMALRGRRIAWASETNDGRRLDSGRVKLLTGGGDLVGRPPFGRREISFPQSHTLFLLTNSKPHVDANDYALWKRLHLIPFSMAFVDDPQAPNERKADKHLIGKLQQESRGILVWLVQGCLEWQRQGLNAPDVVKAATNEYRNDEDLLRQFVEDCCQIAYDVKVGAMELYQNYRNWCTNNGLKPMSGTSFGRKMSERYEKTHTVHGAVYSGLRLITNFEVA